jgi:hypothetical protein
MTPADALASLALIAGLAVAVFAAWRLARRTGLGLAHPAVVWVALHGLLFGLGALALAVLDGRPAAAFYVGAAGLAFAAGAIGSDALAARRASVVPGRASGDDRSPVRMTVAVVLAAVSVALVVPTLAESGIPFLTTDITGARTEIAGLVVQPLRVALPALAVALVLRAHRAAVADRGGATVTAAVALAAIGGFELLLASRYLLAELVVAVVLGWLLAGGRMRWPVVAAGVVVAALVFGGVQLLRAWDLAADRPLDFLAERTVSRVVLVQPRTLDALIRVVPEEEPFFLGLTWVRRLGPLAGRDDIPNIGYWIYPEVVGDPGAAGGYAAPGLIGEAWANFGWAGLVLLGAMGVAAERLGALAAMRREGSADVVAASLAILFFARTHALGLLGLAVLWLVIAAWRLVAGPDGGLRGELGRTLAWRTR